jgi:hypothetical protein
MKILVLHPKKKDRNSLAKKTLFAMIIKHKTRRICIKTTEAKVIVATIKNKFQKEKQYIQRELEERKTEMTRIFSYLFNFSEILLLHAA